MYSQHAEVGRGGEAAVADVRDAVPLQHPATKYNVRSQQSCCNSLSLNKAALEINQMNLLETASSSNVYPKLPQSRVVLTDVR